MALSETIYVGIDLGTSGCRAIAIDENEEVVAEARTPIEPPQQARHHSEQHAEIWWQATEATLKTLFTKVAPQTVQAIAVDGTSGTVLLTDEHGSPLGPALMYNDARARHEAARIADIAPQDCGAHGASSGLAKLLYLLDQGNTGNAHYVLHQADWIAGQFSGRFGISDENNCLKMGYEPVHRMWPDWLDALNVPRALLPDVVTPGTRIGTIQKRCVDLFGLSDRTRIIAGTTDGVAAFLATGADNIGDAVTSLGSTLVLKVMSDKAVFAPEYGVYSHRLGDRWLVGGASNCGGATLLRFFNTQQLAEMTPQLTPYQPTGLDYYPLPAPGERFPECNASLKPRLTPRPDDDVVFFQGMLEGIARVEHQGYTLLAELGAPYPVSVISVGGGANNQPWTTIRQHRLNVSMRVAQHTEAAFGTALLALRVHQ